MDQHIEELFEKAQPFVLGDLSFHPRYAQDSITAMMLEDMILECIGGEVARLVEEYISIQIALERFHCLHFFHQGYLAGKAEGTGRKKS